MIRSLLHPRSLLVALAFALSAPAIYAASPACPNCDKQAGCSSYCRPYGQAVRQDLFRNYYVAPNCSRPAQMYLSPVPTPRLVGHTYVTYQPFMPHEFLYQHHRTYHHRYTNGPGRTTTRVTWGSSPFNSPFHGFGRRGR